MWPDAPPSDSPRVHENVECFEFSEFGLESGSQRMRTLAVENKLVALQAIVLARSFIAVQAVLASIRTGDLKFPVDVNFGEGQSGNKFPHSKACSTARLGASLLLFSLPQNDPNCPPKMITATVANAGTNTATMKMSI